MLGLSNVSFGLKPAARHVLNSVFLHECREAGLDSAIVHAARIVPLHRIDEAQKEAALDLIYDRRRENYDPLTEFMALFENVEAGAIEKEDRSGWPVEERLKHRIIDGERDGLEIDLQEQLQTLTPLQVVNDVLLDGMKVVGELFGSGQMQLPFVLQSAETMKAAVAYLEPLMEKADSGGKGVVVLATVKGDVHDIGKNLVDIILTNNGYIVYNLGIKIAINEMIEKALEVKADAIGMSGLLVKSTIIMRENLQELNTRGLSDTVPVILGGAALDPQLRRARPARGLRRPRLLRQGRVRGSAHDGRARAGSQGRDTRREVRARARRPQPAAPQVGTARRRRRDPCSLRRRDRHQDLHAAVRRVARRQGHLARRHRRLRERDRAVSATSGSSGPSRARTTRISRRASGPRSELSSAPPSRSSCSSRPRHGATSR